MKEKYLEHCRHCTMPVFMQPWWLDVVCGAQSWQPILSLDKNGQIRAAMIIPEKQKYGFRWILQPILTPFLGAWLDYPVNVYNNYKKISFENEVLEDLARQIPSAISLQLQLHFELTNGFAFHAKGFQLGIKYTYYIAPEGSIEETFANVRDYIRTNVRKAERTLHIESSEDIAYFFQLAKNAVERSGTRLSYDFEVFKKLDTAVKSHGERHLLFAKDNEGNIHAGIYFVCDAQTVYYLASGLDEKYKGVATTALIWEGIKLAKSTNRGFDFEGTMLPHVESVFRAFNGVYKPYLTIKRAKNRFFEAALRLLGKY